MRYSSCTTMGRSSIGLSSLWQKSAILARPDRLSFVHLTTMAMGKRQAAPMWVDTADLPTSDGHPFFERVNRVTGGTPSLVTARSEIVQRFLPLWMTECS